MKSSLVEWYILFACVYILTITARVKPVRYKFDAKYISFNKP
jgi:hypothetical protein